MASQPISYRSGLELGNEAILTGKEDGGADVRKTPDERYWFFADFLATPHNLPPSLFAERDWNGRAYACYLSLLWRLLKPTFT